MTEKRPFTLLAMAMLLAGSNRAFAAPSAHLVYLREPGAESCPDEHAIRAAVSSRLGYDPFLAYAKQTIVAEVSRFTKGFKASVKLIDDDNVVRGTRELTHPGDRCSDIVDAMALSISIAIDPDSPSRPSAPLPAPDEPVATASPAALGPRAAHEPVITPTRRAPVGQPPRAGSPLRLEVGVGASGWVGAGPAPNIGGLLVGRIGWRRFSFGLEGRVDAPASTDVVGGTVESRLVYGSIVPCFHANYLGLCVNASVGGLFATSEKVASPNHAKAIHGAVGPRLTVDIPLNHRLSLWARGEVLATFTPQILQLGGIDVYSLPRVSVGTGAGIAVHFF